MNSQSETLTHASNQNRGQPTFKKQVFLILSPSPLLVFRTEQHFASLRFPINEVFSATKDQPWVRRPKLIQYDPALFRAEDYCSYHDNKGHKTTHCKAFGGIWKNLSAKASSKSAFLPSGQPSMQDNQVIHLLPNRNT